MKAGYIPVHIKDNEIHYRVYDNTDHLALAFLVRDFPERLVLVTTDQSIRPLGRRQCHIEDLIPLVFLVISSAQLPSSSPVLVSCHRLPAVQRGHGCKFSPIIFHWNPGTTRQSLLYTLFLAYPVPTQTGRIAMFCVRGPCPRSRTVCSRPQTYLQGYFLFWRFVSIQHSISNASFFH